MRLRSAVAMAATLALGLGAACSSGDGDDAGSATTWSPTSSPAVTGAYQVTGTLTGLQASAAAADPIALPFTITVAERGVGGAEILRVTVNGKASQINWGAGQPLPVRGTGPGLQLGIAPLTVAPDKIIWALDGAARELLPGAYTLGSSVAVGQRGLATPVDSVAFTAGDETTISTRGNATVALSPAPLRIEGREGTLVLVGQLTVQSASGDQRVTRLTLQAGTYEVTLTPIAGGFRIAARLAGRINT